MFRYLLTLLAILHFFGMNGADAMTPVVQHTGKVAFPFSYHKVRNHVRADMAEIFNDDLARINRNSYGIALASEACFTGPSFHEWLQQVCLPVRTGSQTALYGQAPVRAHIGYYRYLFRLTLF